MCVARVIEEQIRVVVVDVRHFAPQGKRHGPLGRRGEICRRTVCLSLLSAASYKPMMVCLIPPCDIRVNCQFAQSVGAQPMCRQRGNGQDDSSLNETLTSQRATRPRQPYSRAILGPVGEGEDARLLWTVQPYSRVCGRMTRGAGKGLGERHRRAGGWDRSVWRKPWNNLPPCPLRLIPPSHPSGHFWAPNPRISPQPPVLLTVFSHRRTALVDRMHRVNTCKMSA